jgi:lipoprotein-releasing system permease protein
MIRRPTSGFILYESFTHYLVSGGFAMVAAVAAGFIPARKAARLDPVEIIRGGV